MQTVAAQKGAQETRTRRCRPTLQRSPSISPMCASTQGRGRRCAHSLCPYPFEREGWWVADNVDSPTRGVEQRVSVKCLDRDVQRESTLVQFASDLLLVVVDMLAVTGLARNHDGEVSGFQRRQR